MTASADQTHATQLYPLNQHIIAKIEGPDAAAFLQGQCTNDVEALAIGQTQHTAHCNHKGRVISSFVLSRESDTSFLLRFHKSLCETGINALAKYIVFSKAKLSSTTLSAFAVIGPFPPEKSEEIQLSVQGAQLFQLSDEHTEIYVSPERTSSLKNTFENVEIKNGDDWKSYLVTQGRCELEQESTELFLPQELNFDCTKAVNFKKGCYTGQEVIARLHYRGQAKKRLRRGYLEPAPLKDFTIDGKINVIDTSTNKNCGTVVLAANPQTTGFEFLAVVSNSSLSSECVLDLISQVKIEWLELPYAIP